MIAFRNCDPRFPFLWEHGYQPDGRWHKGGEGPVHYLANTPDGAWAEFLRHEDIRDPEDLDGVARSLWAIEVLEERLDEPELPLEIVTGDRASYGRCQREAARLREKGSTGVVVPSAAVRTGEANGWRVEDGLKRGPDRDALVFALFGKRPDLIGWEAVHAGRPSADVLSVVHHYDG